MVEIPLTKGKIALIDDEDYEKVSRHKWHICKSKWGQIYAVTDTKTDTGRKIKKAMHRLILDVNISFHILQIDHISGDGLDNRRFNLRICTPFQNAGNQKISKNNTSGYKGVGWDIVKKMWRSCIKINGKTLHLGYFRNKIDAAITYNNVAVKYWGGFAKINPIQKGGE